MKKCSCKGGNPNCNRCGGSGVLNGPIGKSLNEDNKVLKKHEPITSYDSALMKALHAPKAMKAICQYCSKSVNNLALHVSRNHKEKWNDFTKIHR